MPEITTDEGVLRTLSTSVNDLEVENIVEQLSISMPNDALGLSAPQIGIHKRAFIANLSSGSYIFVNPTLIWQSPDEVASIEACLSLPGITRCIGRHSAVSVSCSKIINIKDRSVVAEPEPMRVDGQDSFIVQHETDHLDGILITDHPEVATPEQRRLEREKKRKERIAKKRFEKAKTSVPPKLLKMNAKRLAQKKLAAKKLKKQRRAINRQEKIRVEIQEKYRAEQEGLLEDSVTSAESA